MESTLTTWAQNKVAKQVFPGCVMGVVRAGGAQLVVPFGRTGYQEGDPTVTEHTLYDVASITKAVPVALMLLELIGRKVVSRADSVAGFLPEFATESAKREVLVSHLLTYSVSFELPRLSSLRYADPDEILSTIIAAPLTTKPGRSVVYSEATAILMGLIIERVLGQRLDMCAEQVMFGPLGMLHSTFDPSRSRMRVAPTEVDAERGVVQGVVHNESTYALSKRYVTGGAGLFSTTPDLLRCLAAILSGGESGGKRVFSPETIASLYHPPQKEGYYFHDGWEYGHEKFGTEHSARTFGKTGFTGTMMFLDPDRAVGAVLLSNHTYPSRPIDNTIINTARREFADIVLTYA